MTNTLNKIIHNGDEYELPSGEVGVSDQANNIFTPWMKIWWGTQSDYQSLTPDSNTAYLLLADQPTPPSPWRQPWVNTIAYWKLDWDLTDELWNYDGSVAGSWVITYESLPWDSNVKCAKVYSGWWSDWIWLSSTIWTEWGTAQTSLTFATFMKLTTSNSDAFLLYAAWNAWWCVTNILYNHQYWLWLWLGNNWENDDNVSYTLNTNTRYSVVWTYDHTTRLKSYYVNWVLVGSVTAQNDYNTNATGTQAFLARVNDNTYLSNAVLETNVVWDITTVQSYHDTFKSLYWIS